MKADIVLVKKSADGLSIEDACYTTYCQTKVGWRGFSKPMSIMLVVSEDC
jgi:hypothetical protein